jgi:formyltetrahydrofolate hydrolase
MNLEIECTNTNGVMAKITDIINKEGYNIIAIQGWRASTDTLRFETVLTVEGDARQMMSMRNAVRDLECVYVCSLLPYQRIPRIMIDGA